ncbi:MAG: hypothetical protein K1X35_10040 [Caulobacteraceae bacterium]|nr:hypothetical protein [Caulobacteraceae bacterium]
MRTLLLTAAAAAVLSSPALAAEADPHAGHDMGAMAGGQEGETADAGMSAPPSLLGDYRMSRDASGTSWQPDASHHGGRHDMVGDWLVMSHLTVNAVYDWQDGPRGDERGFVSGMAMISARRWLGDDDSLALRGMFSPDPLMGKEGYPLLLAAGETADGTTPLVDRQHPHDFVMELSATWAHRFTEQDSLFLYGGLPGEPAFGPPAFMHRLSAMDSPEAPISHHWMDSTHITFGVLTAGWVHDDWKVEISRFRGREPDEDRWDIETGALDSTSARISFNPNDYWSLQASWAEVKSPEALDPHEDERRWSVSAIYTVPVGDHGWWSTTLAWAMKQKDHHDLPAWAVESAYRPNADWTLFARAEQIDTDELTPGGGHGPVETVAKLSVGAIRDWRVDDNVTLGLGALYTFNAVPSDLEPSYGGDPQGAMVFARLKVGG